MRRRWVIAAAVIVVVASLLAYREFAVRRATERAVTEQIGGDAEQATENVVWASGKLVPTRWAGLSPTLGGAIETLHVAEGDHVEAGALLVEISAGAMRSQVDVAAAALAEAEAAFDQLLAGATSAQLAAARADVSAAEAQVALAKAGVEQARQSSAAARAQVAISEAQYQQLASQPLAAERVAAQKQMELAEAALSQAQAAYNQVRGDPDIGAMPQSLALQQATIGFEAAKAAYDALLQGATPEQLKVGKEQIAAASAQARMVQSQAPSAEAGLLAAEAQLARTQAALEGIIQGATAEDKAMASARVQSAKAALAAAEAQLAQAQIKAPFEGQVSAIYGRIGEQAIPGQTVLMIGDTSRLYIETTDLRETDVTRLREGMPVEVTFDALPGRPFQGTVKTIAAISSTEKGSTNFTVTVDVADLDPSLRWGMTAFVNIQVR